MRGSADYLVQDTSTPHFHLPAKVFSMRALPRIRPGLLRHSLDRQALVYDSRDDRVHLLDPTTGCVLELLTEGGWTREGIVAELAVRLDVAPDDALVELALEELRKADLLEPTVEVPAALVDVTRRDLIRKLAYTGATAMLIPAIATLTPRRGYAQGSLGGVGEPGTLAECSPCTSDSQCADGNCNLRGICHKDDDKVGLFQECGGSDSIGSRNCCTGDCQIPPTGGSHVCLPKA